MAGTCNTNPFQADRQAGEGIVDGDDHRHVGTADRQRHQHTEQQRAAEEHTDQPQHAVQRTVFGVHDHHQPSAYAQRHQHQQGIDQLQAFHVQWFVDAAIQLGPGNQRAG